MPARHITAPIVVRSPSHNDAPGLPDLTRRCPSWPGEGRTLSHRLSPFAREQIVQVSNPDPFARPVLRSPVVHTPLWMIACAQLLRRVWRLLLLLIRHPLADVTAAVVAGAWYLDGWPGPVLLVAIILAIGMTWQRAWPASWIRFVAVPARCRWRRLFYQRRWPAVMSIARLAVTYRGRLVLPALGRVTASPYVDVLEVRLIPGQSPDDFAARSGNLAHAFGARLCRIRTLAPGKVLVELVRRDALAAIIPALAIPANVDLRAVPVGRQENGTLWTVRLAGAHLLIAGSTGAGKASLQWGLIRGILPALAGGVARILGADPKRMELAFGRAMFGRYGRYEAEPDAIVSMLEDAVASMHARATRLAGKQRDHTPTRENPFTVIFVDEVAFLTAYQPDRKLRERTLAALATLTTQGRAVGYCVIAVLQDPRKDVLTIRNLFPDRIAMRLDEPDQVDLVLGDGARDRGALADQIPADPDTGAGIGYVRIDSAPDPVRVRAAWVSDDDITAMCRQYATDPEPACDRLAITTGAAA